MGSGVVTSSTGSSGSSMISVSGLAEQEDRRTNDSSSTGSSLLIGGFPFLRRGLGGEEILVIHANRIAGKPIAGSLGSLVVNLFRSFKRHFAGDMICTGDHDIRNFPVIVHECHEYFPFLCSMPPHRHQSFSVLLCRAMCNRPAFRNVE